MIRIQNAEKGLNTSWLPFPNMKEHALRILGLTLPPHLATLSGAMIHLQIFATVIRFLGPSSIIFIGNHHGPEAETWHKISDYKVSCFNYMTCLHIYVSATITISWTSIVEDQSFG